MSPFHNPFKGSASPLQAQENVESFRSPKAPHERPHREERPREEKSHLRERTGKPKARSNSIWKSFGSSSTEPPETKYRGPTRGTEEPESPIPSADKLSNRRRSSTTGTHLKKGITSFGLRRPSLPMGGLSFRRPSLPKVAPKDVVPPPPLPESTGWRGDRGPSPPAGEPAYEGLGIDVDDGPGPPRLPTPQPSPKADGHAYFQMDSGPPPITYSPNTPQVDTYEGSSPLTPPKSRSPPGSRPTSSSGRRSRASQGPGRYLPPPVTNGSGPRPGSAGSSSRPRSSIGELQNSLDAASDDPGYDSRLAPPVPHKARQRQDSTFSINSISSRSGTPDDSSRGGSTKGHSPASGRRRSSIEPAPSSRRSSLSNDGSRNKRNTLVNGSSRKDHYGDPELVRKPLPDPSAMYVLRPTVNEATQTPDWGPAQSSYPQQQNQNVRAFGYSQFRRPSDDIREGSFMEGSPASLYPPSPSVRSITQHGNHSRGQSVDDHGAYWDDTIPDTPVANIVTAFRRSSDPTDSVDSPQLVTLRGTTPPRHETSSESSLSSPDDLDDSPKTPTTVASPYFAPAFGPGTSLSPRGDDELFCAFPAAPKRPESPPPAPANLGQRRASAWDLPQYIPQVMSDIQERMRRPSVMAMPSHPSLSVPAMPGSVHQPKGSVAPSIERSHSAPGAMSPTLGDSFQEEYEAPASATWHRTKPSSKLNYEQQAAERAERGRSFFLVQALNNPDHKNRGKEDYQQSQSRLRESDGSDDDSLYVSSPPLGRRG